MKGSYEHSYAAMPGRGAHKGKKVIEKWLRKDPKNFKYVFKMDIQKFFDSIPHAILKTKLSKLIHDKKLLKILYEIIDVTNMGIPLGFYTSQWFSNWYLQDFDHYVKEVLRVKYYVRFMDDIVIMSSSKSFLHYVKDEIEKYLTTKLGLRIKENWQIFKFNYSVGDKECGRDIDFMGFRFFRNRTILRRSIFLKALRKARRISKKEKPTIFEIRQMLSYLGWINCTNTYIVYLNYIKPFVDFQKLKRRISNYDKRKNIKEKEIANECSLYVA